MTIRLYKAYTPGTRNRSVSGFEEIVRSNPQKKLTYGQHNKRGRNNRGVITSRHRGGGHKRLYRQIDFRRNKKNISGTTIHNVEITPGRGGQLVRAAGSV
ncbi:unnamed protein product, partial [Sphagnum troendelagicum]